MMKKTVLAAVAVSAMGLFGASSAEAALRIYCDRGPLPHVPVINGPNEIFVESLMKNYKIERSDAESVAWSVCSDMSAVKNHDRLIDLTYRALAGYSRR